MLYFLGIWRQIGRIEISLVNLYFFKCDLFVKVFEQIEVYCEVNKYHEYSIMIPEKYKLCKSKKYFLSGSLLIYLYAFNCIYPIAYIFQDMVQQYYDISMQDVVETEAKIRNTESEKERMQDQHRNDIRVWWLLPRDMNYERSLINPLICHFQIYVQKVKHLEHEHKNNLSSVASEGSKMRESESLIHEERCQGSFS